jgi:hypothetical protein
MSDIRDESPEALREFLESERGRPDPPPEAEQRVFSRLAVTLALPPGLPAPSSPTTPALPAAATGAKVLVAGGVRRVLSIFLVGATVGAGGYGALQAVRQRPPAQPVTAPRAPNPPAALPAPLPEPALPQIEPPPSPAPQVRPREPGASRDQSLAAERKLLEGARSALVKGDDDGAIASLRRHARIFANGQLAEERDALLIRALVGKGDYAQARERTNRFHQQHPRSLFSEVVDQAMRSIP